MTDNTHESVFQDELISQMQTHGWQLGQSLHYQRATALYEQDVLNFVQTTQPKAWDKLCRLMPVDSERYFMDTLVKQLNKADINATDRLSRTYGTLGVLRHGLKVRTVHFSLCQFKPEHDLNPDIIARYEGNICRIVPEVVYSPHTSQKNSANGKVAKRNRIDVVLFVNGLPVVTMELKSEFKQSVHNAIAQYKTTRHPKDPNTKKPEPLLTFKRGALVHFAVSQYEVHMTTQLAGEKTYFLPFNKGSADGGSGNAVSDDLERCSTDYLWSEVLTPDSLLVIIGRFVHLQIDEVMDGEGRQSKKESLIFPRYHQWDVVNKLIQAATTDGSGHKYLIQHSAGSGKSNSIAWTAHQLSTLHDSAGDKQFHSVIVITDRTVLDDQLQDTIYQFEHADGVVERITKEGSGSKSAKLAAALIKARPIIIVTLQTFPFILKAIEDSSILKSRRYAIIADEAHSSQSGLVAKKLRNMLISEEEISDEDQINEIVSAHGASQNLNYYAFTATPKAKTIELFGRVPNPDLPASKDNLPAAYHVYSMRQAIEEGFILDVLKNYISYQVLFKLSHNSVAEDKKVNSRRATIKLNQWARLHERNISEKVKIIIEHFEKNVKGLLGGNAKAMVVTGSRKEAVRYKLAFDKYIREKGYQRINAMVAFSGEVSFDSNDPNSSELLEQTFTENNMNPDLNGRDMRKAFDSPDYQVMLVANKFQTGFDQPKLCAMYVDKKLGGVDCVQTLSRLNRASAGKAQSGTFVLDFVNDPKDVVAAFQPYYQTATLEDVSDPDSVSELYDKLCSADIFIWKAVEQFWTAFYTKTKSSTVISNIIKPAIDRWHKRYKAANEAVAKALKELEQAEATNDTVEIANAKMQLKDCQIQRNVLEVFKKDLGTFTRKYEFMSQIFEYEDKRLEQLSLYARYLQPQLRQRADDDEVDLSNIEMSHYRLSKLRQQDLELQEDSNATLQTGSGSGSGKAKPEKEEALSQVVARLNMMFDTERLTDSDLINYSQTIWDKINENEIVMQQIANNPADKVMLGDFPDATLDAIFDSQDAYQEITRQLLSNSNRLAQFTRFLLDNKMDA